MDGEETTVAKVLVVEDEHDICWALTRILERMGYGVIITHTGVEARRQMSRGSFRLGVIDAKLPDMDGISLAKNIKGVQAELPLILISGYFYYDDDVVREITSNGLFCEFISKPFQVREIQNAVALAVSQRDRHYGRGSVGME